MKSERARKQNGNLGKQMQLLRSNQSPLPPSTLHTSWLHAARLANCGLGAVKHYLTFPVFQVFTQHWQSVTSLVSSKGNFNSLYVVTPVLQVVSITMDVLPFQPWSKAQLWGFYKHVLALISPSRLTLPLDSLDKRLSVSSKPAQDVLFYIDICLAVFPMHFGFFLVLVLFWLTLGLWLLITVRLHA